MNGRNMLAGIAVLALAAATRIIHAPRIFRGETILAGNDPWFYLVRVRGVQSGAPIESGEPLYVWVATRWADALALAGLDTTTALAVLPVVLAAVTTALVMVATRRLTGDIRATVAAGALYATAPGAVRYSMVGVPDHHALDQFLLAAMVVALVALARGDRRGTVSLAGLVAASGLAWEGAPVLWLVLAAGAGGLAVGGHPRRARAVSVAFVGGAALLGLKVLALGWQSPLLVAAAAGLAVGIELAGQLARGRWQPLAPVAASGVLAPIVVPGLLARIAERVASDLFGHTGTVEATPLLGAQSLLTLGPLWFVGPALVLAPAVIGVCWRYRTEPAWAALAGTVAALSALVWIQLRFGGLLSVGGAVVGGPALVALLHRADAARGLGAGQLGTVRAGLSAVAVVGLLLAACFAAAALGTAALPATDEQVAATAFINDHGGGTVLTNWGQARQYNALVDGGASGASYQRSKRAFAPVVRGERAPPPDVQWVVVDTDRRPAGYDESWHAGEAERMWSRSGTTVYHVSLQTHKSPSESRRKS